MQNYFYKELFIDNRIIFLSASLDSSTIYNFLQLFNNLL